MNAASLHNNRVDHIAQPVGWAEMANAVSAGLKSLLRTERA